MHVYEYFRHLLISEEPTFEWWVSQVTNKGNRIISKVKSKYWSRTHKYGVRIPKPDKMEIEIDKVNGNTLLWESIFQEMKNVRAIFKI